VVASGFAHLLIVDDEPDVRNFLTECLDETGYRIVAVSHPQAALEACQQHCFHLALVDVRLPGITGLELIPQLQALAPQMGIILITAYAQLDHAVRAFRDLNVLDYILRPTPATAWLSTTSSSSPKPRTTTSDRISGSPLRAVF
jgi:DNA-binding NtrC family response regulator